MPAAPPPPDVSVVIPAYNEEGHLDATLESLGQQDFAGSYEIVVVDNASTDGTAEVARAGGARVVLEPGRGVCVARQTGTSAARGAIVVSTDADTLHPRDWLRRLVIPFGDPGVVAVAGPCRYADAPRWASVVPPLWFAAVGGLSALGGPLLYLTATNVAFRRAGFPGYDTRQDFGGDEVDLLRRLRRWGRVVWCADLPVLTSSRRIDQGLAHTVVVSYGYHYALASLLTRLTGRRVLGVAPAIRRGDADRSRHVRRRWRVALLATSAALVGLTLRARGRGAD